MTKTEHNYKPRPTKQAMQGVSRGTTRRSGVANAPAPPIEGNAAPSRTIMLDTKTSNVLDTEAAAEYLGLKPTTLETWRSTRRVALPYIKVGRSVRYRLRDLDAFLDGNTHGEIEQD